MAKDINQAVREVCLWLPEAEEFLSHGSPNFRVRGKTFATYCVNHHGDGRVALWLSAPAGAQALYVREEPKHFFVPPYVGPRGWLGVNLDKGISWKRVAKLVREAYENVAPRTLVANVGKTIEIKPPPKTLKPEQIDPLQSKAAQTVLRKFRALCLDLPETAEGSAFGSPVWRAGKKTFAWAGHGQGRLTLSFWVGVDRQGLLTSDPRYRIPAYMGHNGWISLDVTAQRDWDEIAELARASYRHFALKRMLDALT
ncbi:MAG TPA: MmcQ/YjbR family DNA-binding protein [Povalibacter sp.]